jgi:hypothetical protein
MSQVLTPFDSLLITIVLVTSAIGLPILVLLALRFLWDRHVYLGRSKELEKLIWQLHRIDSAMEHQMNLSFPAVEPGTEDASDLVYLQQPAAQAKATARPAAQNLAAPSAAAPVAKEPGEQQSTTPEQVSAEYTLPPLVPRDASAEAPRAGVNSMFGL